MIRKKGEDSRPVKEYRLLSDELKFRSTGGEPVPRELCSKDYDESRLWEYDDRYDVLPFFWGLLGAAFFVAAFIVFMQSASSVGQYAHINPGVHEGHVTLMRIIATCLAFGGITCWIAIGPINLLRVIEYSLRKR